MSQKSTHVWQRLIQPTRTKTVLPACVKATPIKFTNTLRDAVRVPFEKVSVEPNSLLRPTIKLGKMRMYSRGLYFGMYANGWTMAAAATTICCSFLS
jgi:hypothetical protein